MNSREIERLHHLVHAAQAIVRRPWEPGETSRPIEFFTDHLDDEGWRLGWTLVAALRERAPELFRLYSEEGLHRALLDLLLSRPSPPPVQGLVAELLEQAAEDNGPWLVSIPLANASLSRPWAPLSESAVMWRAPTAHQMEDQEARETLEQEETKAEFAVFHHLGDRIRPASAVLRLGSGREIETGRTVSMLLTESGPPVVATETARMRAQYALATWSLLAPPKDWHVLPDLGVWAPQPNLTQATVYKRFDPGQWISSERRRGGSYREWGPYDLPADDVLTAPFEAFEHLDRRPAQALLSATLAAHSASRATRSLLSERIRDVRAAVESLCEPPAGSSQRVRKRWERVAVRFGVWDRVAENRAYTPALIAEVQRRIVNARNISAHGADAALIDLGWLAGDRALRLGSAAATDLARSALHRDLAPMVYAVSEAIRCIWSAMRDAEFEEAAFEQLFAPTA
jgi:hypothetical protein